MLKNPYLHAFFPQKFTPPGLYIPMVQRQMSKRGCGGLITRIRALAANFHYRYLTVYISTTGSGCIRLLLDGSVREIQPQLVDNSPGSLDQYVEGGTGVQTG